MEPNWRKPRRSVANGACVETASEKDMILVRDTLDNPEMMLDFTSETWRTFIATLKTQVSHESGTTSTSV